MRRLMCSATHAVISICDLRRLAILGLLLGYFLPPTTNNGNVQAAPQSRTASVPRFVLADNRLPAPLAPGDITTYAGRSVIRGAPRQVSIGPEMVTLLGPTLLLIADDYRSTIWLLNRGRQSVTKYGTTVPAGIMAVVAGDGSAGDGGDGGPATRAELDQPEGLVVDRTGNLYIADSVNALVREVHAGSGIISTVAGNRAGTAGRSGDGGPAIRAGLYGPAGLALDHAGNLYIADSNNHVVREVHAGSGIITTVVGIGKAGYSGDGKRASRAELNDPEGLIDDRAGNLYIADSNNNRVREVHAGTGIITTVAGNGKQDDSGDGGPADQAELAFPEGLALDQAGNLYISDDAQVREVHRGSGIITSVAGGGLSEADFAGDGGPANRSVLNLPRGLALDQAGNLYIADSLNGRIREVLAGSSIINTIVGTGKIGYSGDGRPSAQAELNAPTALAVDRAGNLYIADQNNAVVREVRAGSGIITTVAGNGVLGDNGDGGPATQAELGVPDGLAVDQAGNLFIADGGGSHVREVHLSNGIISTVAGSGGIGYSGDGGPATQAQLGGPEGLAVDRAGNLYIADSLNDRVREVHAGTGIITTVAGNGQEDFGGDGRPATQAKLDSPDAVAVDRAGNLYIADSLNDRVREVHAGTGIITTLAGSDGPENFGGDGGPATRAELFVPEGLALDQAGNLYIADSFNDRVREVQTGTGIITTVAGTGREDFGGDGGPAIQAKLDAPGALALDQAGNLYIADAGSNRVRVVRLLH